MPCHASKKTDIRTRLIFLLVLAFAVCYAAAVIAAQDDKVPPGQSEISEVQTGKQCQWACQKWSKLCNVDPRGVYKCRRSCAKFGEVCEE